MRTRYSIVERTVGACLGAAYAAAVAAGPADPTVRAGTASVATAGSATTVTQTSDRAVIDWRSFDIAVGESVTFNQPGVTSAILNRVTGTQFSSIQGSLSANGQVYLVNPNGLLIGNGATINAASFVASTANIGTTPFMTAPAAASGRYVFDELTSNARSGSIVNAGTITAADGGLVALVAPSVRNSGLITARLGKVTLASANYFTLDLFGDDLVRVAVSDSIANAITDVTGAAATAQVSVSGETRADGGRVVLMSVPAAANVFNEAVNLSGVARAQTVAAGKEGTILLLADGGNTKVSGAIDATATDAALHGGRIEVQGRNVELTSTARLDASGNGGGGIIGIGGKFSNAGRVTETATTHVVNGSIVNACGAIGCPLDGLGGSGDGGKISLYSANDTTLSGWLNVSAAENHFAGTLEALTNLGPTTLDVGAHMTAKSGSGKHAGFMAIVGDTLTISPSIFIDMFDYAGFPSEGEHRTEVELAPYIVPPALPFQTDAPVLFHAFSSDSYGDTLRAMFPDGSRADGFDALTFVTPVGSLRPNGGVTANLSAGSSDPLTAVPITFTPDPPPSGGGVGGGGTGGGGTSPSDAISETANRLASDRRTETGRGSAGGSDSDGAMLTVVSGGPGIAQSADLGRAGPVPGANADVFGTNYHVLTPSGGSSDAPVADYLCKTPFSRNGCGTHAGSK